MKCPLATQDSALNLKNRNIAFKNVGYGPANPDQPNGAFWNDKSNTWQTDLKQAKSMRCANCAAFIQTPEMLSCIQNSLGFESDYPSGKDALEVQEQVRDAADLGYCQLFAFKCAAQRVCDAWLLGGPITSMSEDYEDDPFKVELD